MKNLLKIVIIDDEMILRNGLKYLCNWESHGFTIAGEAANGIEGFQLVEQLRPDIVITDIVMPGMDGISLTARIKEHFPDIHIIVLSSYDNFSYAKSGFKLGIDDYLLKPELEASDLLHLLEKLRSQEIKPHGFGIGLININERIKLMFGKDYGLTLYNENDWAVARIIMPYITDQEGILC